MQRTREGELAVPRLSPNDGPGKDSCAIPLPLATESYSFAKQASLTQGKGLIMPHLCSGALRGITVKLVCYALAL